MVGIFAISRVAFRKLASSAFEFLSGSSNESADTAVRSISIGSAWLASMSITDAVSSDSARDAASSRRNDSSSSPLGRWPRRIRKQVSS